MATVSACIAQVVERKPLERTAFNTAVYALSAFAAALPVFFLGPPTEDPVAITVDALLGGAAFVARQLRVHLARDLVPPADPGAPAAQGGSPARRAGVHDPGVPRSPRRRALGDRSSPARPHGRPALHRHALPALVARLAPRDARCAHRQPHADRQQPRYELGLSTALDSAAESGRVRQPLPGRRRRLQADQRHLRSSARRPGARRGRRAPADGARLPRHVPLRRRRVRDPPRAAASARRARTSSPSTVGSRSPSSRTVRARR